MERSQLENSNISAQQNLYSTIITSDKLQQLQKTDIDQKHVTANMNTSLSKLEDKNYGEATEGNIMNHIDNRLKRDLEDNSCDVNDNRDSNKLKTENISKSKLCADNRINQTLEGGNALTEQDELELDTIFSLLHSNMSKLTTKTSKNLLENILAETIKSVISIITATKSQH